MFVYENHLGGLYASDDKLNDDVLYCKVCGGSDWFIGEANTQGEAWELLKGMIDLNGQGGYDLKVIKGFISDNFNSVGERVYLATYTVNGIIVARNRADAKLKTENEWDELTDKSDFQSVSIKEI